MRKYAFLLPVTVCIFMFFTVPAQVQPHQHPKPAFPEYHKYTDWRKHLKVDPYKQDTLLHPIPFARVGWHDKIDKEQMIADKTDGKIDTFIRYKSDTGLSGGLTQSLLYNVDTLQILIENMPPEGRDSFAAHQVKIRYLRAVWEMLRSYNNDPRPDPRYYIMLEDNMDSLLVAINKHKTMDFVMANANIYTLENSKNLFENPSPERAAIYVEMGKNDPVRMIKRLAEYAADSFASEIIKAAAPLAPAVVFEFATSTNLPLKSAVYRTDDSLVQSIVKIAAFAKSPPKVFPFLADIYYGRKTVEELDTVANHPNLYFENLVRLRMENDTLNMPACARELGYQALKCFIRPMNDLHEEQDDVRFACIDSLPATALFYLMVYGQDEIYTSTFLGTFKRMMERMSPMKGNQLIDTLRFDHFRTFIRMCAGYNTLTEFLASMDDTSRTSLMTRFIGGLENGREDDLEDAVDVADAFGSIRDSALTDLLEKKVKENYEYSYYTIKNRKGMIIYSLLARLFDHRKTADADTGTAAVSSRLHLPPINKVLYKDLVNDSGIVYQQVFFFGDKDGKDSYDSYLSEFANNKNWSVITKNNWTEIASLTGKKIVIYANPPLDEPGDENAQDTLSQFLRDSGIHPTIMIHRGHSYHLPVTLARLNSNVKIVILGSCGGYHNLALVLDHAPDAHIISSKQTGSMTVNEPIIEALNRRLLQGEDINWTTMWEELDAYFQKKPDAQDKFSDYVPPYKNLGAIFIKAYRKMMNN